MKNRPISLLLALALTLSLLPAPAWAREPGLSITEVVPCQYDYMEAASEGLLAVKKDGKWGFIDLTGQVVVPLIYDNAGSFSEGLARVYLDVGEDGWESYWTFIDPQGKAVITLDKSATIVWDFQEGRAVVHTRLGETVIDKTGKELVAWDRDYEDIRSCSDGMFRVKKDGRYGYLNAQGEEVIPCGYLYAEDFSEGLAAVKRDETGGWTYVDKTGREAVASDVPELPYFSARTFSGGLAVVTRTDLNGGGQSTYLDRTGAQVIDQWFGRAADVSEGLAVVTEGSSFGSLHSYILDMEAGEGTELERSYYYDRAQPFSEGMALVENHATGKWGCVNRNGQEVIPCRYDEDEVWNAGYSRFSNGVMWVRDGAEGKYGYIDREGRQVLPYTYDEAGTFSEGVAVVGRKDGEGRMTYGLIAVTQAAQPAPSPLTAYASTQSIQVFGTPVELHCYALKDEKGNYTNYVQIRELARALNGTEAQFNVDWNGAVVLQAKTPYGTGGAESAPPFSGDQPCRKLSDCVVVNGETMPLDGLVITDAQGGAYTYYQLRELGEALRFTVEWTPERGISLPCSLFDRYPDQGKLFFEAAQ